jgi:hypothetical protein
MRESSKRGKYPSDRPFLLQTWNMSSHPEPRFLGLEVEYYGRRQYGTGDHEGIQLDTTTKPSSHTLDTTPSMRLL